MASEASIVGAVWSYGSDSRAVILTLGEDAIEWHEFPEDTAAGALAMMEEVRQGRSVLYTHRSIPLARVQRVETDPPDPHAQPRRVGTLKIATGGLFGDHDVVCAYEEDCPWESFVAFGERILEGSRATRAAQQTPRPKRSLAGAIRRLADRVLPAQAACPHCGAEVETGAAFCRACGQELAAPQASRCAACGKDVPQRSTFCPHCGARQA